MANGQKGKLIFKKIKAAVCLALAFIIMGALIPTEVSAASFNSSGKVQGIKVSKVTYNSVTLQWKKYKKATGYQVYRATTRNGQYSRIKTTTKTSFKRTNLTTNKTCYYKVRAYYGKSGSTRKYSKYSAVVTGRPVMKKPVISAVPAGSGVFVSWKKVSGAKGYKVYRATSKSGRYSLLQTTGSTSYTDTSAKAGRTYYYKVRAYRVVRTSTKHSSYSSIKRSISAPGKTQITAAQKGNAIEITWKAAAGAQAYEVYRSTELNGKYTAIRETAELKYSDRAVTDGVTYYYKVKAYIKVGSNRIFGDWAMGKYSRDQVVKCAEAWLGYNETNGKYKEIIDVYNAGRPPGAYRMKYSDHWCAAYVSAVAMKAGTTPIMHVECSCNRMMKLYQKSKDWVEDDAYVPSRGDILFYDWNDGRNYSGDNLGIPHHVGIVTGVSADNVTSVIEGNRSDTVKYCTIKVNGRFIRGFGTPKYDAVSGVTFVKPAVQNQGVPIILSMGDGSIEMEESGDVVDSYRGHLNKIKKNAAGFNSEYEQMEFILQYVRENMAPNADEPEISAYYARLIYDICAEMGITASLDSVPDASGALYSTNTVILDDKACMVDASRNTNIIAFELED